MGVLFFAFSSASVQAAPLFPLPDLSGLSDALAKIAKQNKCKAIRTKMGTKATSINNMGKSNYDKLNEMSARLDQIIHNADDKGYNVDKLKQDTSAFKDYVTDYHKKYDYAQGVLKVSALLAGCMNDPDSDMNHMKENLGDARSNMNSAKSLVVQAKNFYRNSIKADLFDMSTQKYKE